MQNQTKKTPLKELGSLPSNFIAPAGMFIATMMPDSCIYQIGDPTTDRESAFILCSEYRGMDVEVQIFDDQGKCHIINGKLKELSPSL